MSNRKLALVKLHPEILRKNGRNEFVVLPYEEFVAMKEQLEDALDLVDLRRAMAEDDGGPSLSIEEVKTQLGLNPKRRQRKARRYRST